MPGVAWSCLELPGVAPGSSSCPGTAPSCPATARGDSATTFRAHCDHSAQRPGLWAVGPQPQRKGKRNQAPCGEREERDDGQKNAGRHPTQLGKTIVAENVENYKAAPEGGLRKARSTPTPFCRPKAVYHQKTLRHGTWILPRKTAKIAAPFFDAPMCETGAVKRPKIVKVTLFLSLTNDGSLSNLHSTGIVIPDKFVKKTSAEWAKMARGICGH